MAVKQAIIVTQGRRSYQGFAAPLTVTQAVGKGGLAGTVCSVQRRSYQSSAAPLFTESLVTERLFELTQFELPTYSRRWDYYAGQFLGWTISSRDFAVPERAWQGWYPDVLFNVKRAQFQENFHQIALPNLPIPENVWSPIYPTTIYRRRLTQLHGRYVVGAVGYDLVATLIWQARYSDFVPGSLSRRHGFLNVVAPDWSFQVASEAVTLDKWWVAASEPRREPFRAWQHDYRYHVDVEILPVPELSWKSHYPQWQLPPLKSFAPWVDQSTQRPGGTPVDAVAPGLVWVPSYPDYLWALQPHYYKDPSLFQTNAIQEFEIPALSWYQPVEQPYAKAITRHYLPEYWKIDPYWLLEQRDFPAAWQAQWPSLLVPRQYPLQFTQKTMEWAQDVFGQALQRLVALSLSLSPELSQTMSWSGNVLPVQIVSQPPTVAPPGNKGVVFYVAGVVVRVYVWDGASWQVLA